MSERKMRRVEALEVLEEPHRVEARLTCGHTVESWAGQSIGALRRCRECERAHLDDMRKPHPDQAALAASEVNHER